MSGEPKTDIEWLKECVELLGLEIGKLTKRVQALEERLSDEPKETTK